MHTSNIRNVIFDLGAVLLEWNPEAVVAKAFKDENDRTKAQKGILNHPDWLELDRGTLTGKQAIPRFSVRTGLTEDSVENLLDIARKSLVVKNDTLGIVKRCQAKGLDVYCLSNMSVYSFEYVQRRYDFFKDFKGIVVSAYINMIKPEPEIFKYTLSRYELSPQQTIFIDDNEHNITVAKSMGFKAHRFVDAYSCEEEVLKLLAKN